MANPAPRLLLFDIDGTLVSAAGAGRAALGAAFVRLFGVDREDYAAARVRFDGNTDPVIMRELAVALGLDMERFERQHGEFLDAYFSELREEMSRTRPERRVLPGVERLLRELERRGEVHLGLLTGNLEPSARIKLEPFGLNRFFPDGGFGSDHADRREIARIAREKLSRSSGRRFEPGSVTVVGDTERDVECAVFNGYRSLAVATGWTAIERLEAAGPDAFVSDLSDLAGTLRALDLEQA